MSAPWRWQPYGCLWLVVQSPLLSSGADGGHVEIVQHSIECRQILALDSLKGSKLFVEPPGELREDFLLLRRGRRIRALDHGIERQQLIVDLDRPVQGGFVGVGVRLADPAAHCLEPSLE